MDKKMNEKMEQFQLLVEEMLKRSLGDDYKIQSVCQTKNNGTRVYGIMVEHSVNKAVKRVLYLEEYQRIHEAGICLELIVGEIIQSIKEDKFPDHIPVEDLRNMMVHYEMAQDKIRCKLVNSEANKELLKNIPHIPFLDLSIVFYIDTIPDHKQGTASIPIHQHHVKRWNIDSAQLLGDALKNMGECSLQSMSELSREFLMESQVEIPEEELKILEEECALMEEMQKPMYILTNEKKLYGASCILKKEPIEALAEKWEKDVIILPSSIHECILVPLSEEMDLIKAAEMVCEVNHEKLDREERLSNSVYYYDREDKEIHVAVLGEAL